MTTNLDTASIKSQMDAYRRGECPLPKEYIKLHEYYAIATLSDLCKQYGFRPLFTDMVDDGWCTGFRGLRAICEDQNGKIHDCRWSDSNGGSWYECHSSGGMRLIYNPPKTHKPGYI